MGPRQRGSDLRVAGLLGASLALSACTVDDGDRFRDLDVACGDSWEYEGYPAPDCEEALISHLGIEPTDWEDEARDLEFIIRGMWALARAPIDLHAREEKYDAVASGIISSEPGASEIRLGHASLNVQHGVASAGCTVVHEGRHSSYGGHDLQGKYDFGMDGPYGWCIQFAESFAELGVDDGEADYVVQRKRRYIR